MIIESFLFLAFILFSIALTWVLLSDTTIGCIGRFYTPVISVKNIYAAQYLCYSDIKSICIYIFMCNKWEITWIYKNNTIALKFNDKNNLSKIRLLINNHDVGFLEKYREQNPKLYEHIYIHLLSIAQSYISSKRFNTEIFEFNIIGVDEEPQILPIGSTYILVMERYQDLLPEYKSELNRLQSFLEFYEKFEHIDDFDTYSKILSFRKEYLPGLIRIMTEYKLQFLENNTKDEAIEKKIQDLLVNINAQFEILKNQIFQSELNTVLSDLKKLKIAMAIE